MQTCAEALNWGSDHSLWSPEDPTRMGTTWQFPVWIIMFCFLSVSQALSISMIIIFTLRPALKYKWWYLLLNSCHVPPQNQLLFSSDAGAENMSWWDQEGEGVLDHGGVRAAPSLWSDLETLLDEKPKPRGKAHFKQKRDKYTSRMERSGESL